MLQAIQWSILPLPAHVPAVTEVFPKHQRDHIIPSISPPRMFRHLQWLPIASQITFQPFTLVFKAIPQNGPNLSSQLLPCSLINCYTFPLLCLCSPHPLCLQCSTTSYLEGLHPPKSSSSLSSCKIPSLTILAGRDISLLELLCFLH